MKSASRNLNQKSGFHALHVTVKKLVAVRPMRTSGSQGFWTLPRKRKNLRFHSRSSKLLGKKGSGCGFRQMVLHQTFQVPKMEVLNLIRLFWGWVSPYISLTALHTAYIGEYLHFRHLKCLVSTGIKLHDVGVFHEILIGSWDPIIFGL